MPLSGLEYADEFGNPTDSLYKTSDMIPLLLSNPQILPIGSQLSVVEDLNISHGIIFGVDVSSSFNDVRGKDM